MAKEEKEPEKDLSDEDKKTHQYEQTMEGLIESGLELGGFDDSMIN